jgi:hypothetical protein
LIGTEDEDMIIEVGLDYLKNYIARESVERQSIKYRLPYLLFSNNKFIPAHPRYTATSPN